MALNSPSPKFKKLLNELRKSDFFYFRNELVPRVLVSNQYVGFTKSPPGAAPGSKMLFFQYLENG